MSVSAQLNINSTKKQSRRAFWIATCLSAFAMTLILQLTNYF